MSFKKFWPLALGVMLLLATVFLQDGFPSFPYSFQSCSKPIGYTIGTFDTRFGISREYFIDALSQAEAIWEEAIGKELFVYAPENGEMAVNLVFDYRQEVTSTLSELEETVEEDEALYRSLQTQYNGLKAEYERVKSDYETRVETFNEKNNAYQEQVELWNNSPRNSRAQLEELEAQRISLEADMSRLRILEARLNELSREINVLVGRLNRLARSLNLDAETYNTIGASRGETFTGGLYYHNGDEQGIDIYEFSSRDKLVRILAHELGHALGLEHIDDPEAMMYHLNQGEVGVLSDTDVASLRTLCRIE
ncbi:MAG: matrixin family metalloprotease [Parcubacteria group bacterium]